MPENNRFDFGRTFDLMKAIQENEDLNNGLEFVAGEMKATGTSRFTFTYMADGGAITVEWKTNKSN